MGEAYITRRGSGTQLKFKIDAYSSVDSLPLTAKEGSFAVITSANIGKTHVGPIVPTNVESGAIYLSSRGSEASIVLSEQLELLVTGAFIWNGSEWDAVDTYVFRDGEWAFVGSGQIYNAGNEYVEYTGGFVARKISSRSDASATTVEPKITVNSNNIVADTTSSGSNGVGMFCTDKRINLTPYKAIVFEGEFISNYTNYANNFIAGAWPIIPTYYTIERLAYVSMTTSPNTQLIVDVSDINSDAYVGFGIAYSKVTLTNCYLILKDEFDTTAESATVVEE